MISCKDHILIRVALASCLVGAGLCLTSMFLSNNLFSKPMISSLFDPLGGLGFVISGAFTLLAAALSGVVWKGIDNKLDTKENHHRKQLETNKETGYARYF